MKNKTTDELPGEARKRNYTSQEFNKTFGKEWKQFRQAYLAPIDGAKTGESKDENHGALLRVLQDDGKVCHEHNDIRDLELLYDLAFKCKTFGEFLTKHLKLRKADILSSLDDGVDKDGKPKASRWRQQESYKELLSSIGSAARALSNYAVAVDKETRLQRSPMLHAIEDALIEKWMVLRDEKLENHRFMEGRPLSHSTKRQLGGELQKIMRGEIGGGTEAFFARQVIWDIFISKCRTSIKGEIEEFCTKALYVSKRQVSIEEAVGYLLGSYNEKLDSTLYTYALSNQKENGQDYEMPKASFSSLLASNLKSGLTSAALRNHAQEYGISYPHMESPTSQAILRTISLDNPVKGKNGESTKSFGDIVRDKRDEKPSLGIEERQAISNALQALPERERAIIEMRFGLGENQESYTLAEVGEVFGVTRERVRQIESKILKQLAQTLKGFSGAIHTESAGRRH